MDLDETDKELVVTPELPGATDKDVKVSLAGDVLTIKSEKKTETKEKKGDAHFTERRYGSFACSLRPPFEVKHEHMRSMMHSSSYPAPHGLDSFRCQLSVVRWMTDIVRGKPIE